jgi:AcrR family transcriptional regulator
MADHLPQMLRSDAEENRDRILTAARELFSERGLDVTMREVARRAEVGPATVYRRFPTKADLVEAAFADQVRLCRSIVDEGCADPDPWRGFCSVVEEVSALNARSRGFVDAFMSVHPEAEAIAAHRASVLAQLDGLSRRAKTAGGLRRDFAIDDLVLVLLAGRGVAALPPAQRERAAGRFAELAIDAFRA